MKYSEAWQLLQMHLLTCPVDEVPKDDWDREDEEEDSPLRVWMKKVKESSCCLWRAIEIGKEDDRILEEAIIKASRSHVCKGSDGHLQDLSNHQFKSWEELAKYYIDVLCERGSMKGYEYKVQDLLSAEGGFNRALNLALELDRVGLSTYDTYLWLGNQGR